MLTTEEILCSKTHECVLKKDNYYLIGLTDYFVDKIGEVLSLELPDVGMTFEKGEIFGTLQSVKFSKDLYMPVGGTVTEINEDVVANTDALGENNWLIKIESETAVEDSIDLYEYDDYIDETSIH